ncbi:MAG: N-acetyltransferase family protein [Caulobacteraceae bacterium]
MNIDIRQISNNSNKCEVDKFIEAFLELFNDNENLPYLSFTNIPFEKDTVQNWISEASQAGVEYYIALDENDKIIGILTIRINKVEVFEIMAVVVNSHYRNKGVGRLLIDKAVQKASEKGFKSIDVAVFADNKNMLSLMIKNKFKPYKIENRKRFDGEDIVYLKRYL